MYVIRYTTKRSGYVRSTTFRSEAYARTRFGVECDPAFNAKCELIGPSGEVIDAWSATPPAQEGAAQ